MASAYYALLGISPGASSEEIRTAYRRKAFELHPDRNGGSPEAEEAFKRVTEAYAVLSDPRRRAAYDAARRAGKSANAGFPPQDLFADLFGRPEFSRMFRMMSEEFRANGVRFDEAYLRRVLSRRGSVVFGGFFFAGSLADLMGHLFGRPRHSDLESRAEPHPLPSRKPGLLRQLLGKALPRPGNRGARDVHFDVSLQTDLLDRGGKIRVALPSQGGTETLEVRVPSGTRPGTRLRLRGRGNGAASRRGDLYLRLDAQRGQDEVRSPP